MNLQSLCLISSFYSRKGEFISDINPVISYVSSPKTLIDSNNKTNSETQQGNNKSTENNHEIKEQQHETHTKGDDNEEDIEETQREEEALRELDNIVNSFRWYYYYVQKKLDSRNVAFSSLPQRHRLLVPDFESKAAKKNYELLIRVIPPQTTDKVTRPNPASEADMDKVKTSLQQIVRDWSAECAGEREKCYSHIISALNKRYPDESTRGSLQVLVPGAGLCRLAFDIAKQGYQCQANEFSFSMLLIANFILNKNHGVKSHKIYPWLLNFSNNFHTNDQLQEYSIPDVDTSVRGGNLSMCAGDFLEIYTESGMFDVVVTCFFLDTAHNVINYIEQIYKLLKPSGVWINLGPLLYHYSDVMNEDSLDLSYEQIKHVITETGFVIENEQYPVSIPYVENKQSMQTTIFNCVNFTAVKQPPIGNITLKM